MSLLQRFLIHPPQPLPLASLARAASAAWAWAHLYVSACPCPTCFMWVQIPWGRLLQRGAPAAQGSACCRSQFVSLNSTTTDSPWEASQPAGRGCTCFLSQGALGKWLTRSGKFIPSTRTPTRDICSTDAGSVASGLNIEGSTHVSLTVSGQRS